MEIGIFFIENKDDFDDVYDIIHPDNDEALWPWQWPYFVLICFRDIMEEEEKNYERIISKIKEAFNSPEFSAVTSWLGPRTKPSTATR